MSPEVFSSNLEKVREAMAIDEAIQAKLLKPLKEHGE